MFRKSIITISAVFVCTLSGAQVVSPIAGANNPATVFGSGERPGLRYSGEEKPENLLLMQMAYEGAYDDNPLNAPGATSPDEVQTMTGSAYLQHHGEYLESSLGYQPTYDRYVQHPDYSQFNQYASADIALMMTEGWSLRLRDDYSRQTGPYQPLSSTITSSLGSPNGLNETIYEPLSRAQTDSGRIDAFYRPGLRTFFNIFGGYDTQSYSEVSTVIPPYKTRGPNFGAEYAWRPSEHSIAGMLGMYQRLNLVGNQTAGSASHVEIESLLPTYGWNPRPVWQFQGYVGPQIIAIPSGTATKSSSQIGLAGGLTIAGQWNRTAFLLAGNHALANGGGLLTFVHNTTVDAGIRRRAAGKWDINLGMQFARNIEIPGMSAGGSFTEMSATAGLARPLRGNMILHAGYDFIWQTAAGNAPAMAEFHRNRIAAGISWQIGTLPLNR